MEVGESSGVRELVYQVVPERTREQVGQYKHKGIVSCRKRKQKKRWEQRHEGLCAEVKKIVKEKVSRELDMIQLQDPSQGHEEEFQDDRVGHEGELWDKQVSARSSGQYSLSLKPSLDDPRFDLILLSSRFASELARSKAEKGDRSIEENARGR
ncbi:hypothetical protein CDL15_Pgr018389 [Punica granatum]|uniref:Uncharacterized protein n=1 Tax=Punica granatum TaxID=22663 RepID=A0A218W3K6_PUNGR|nr:hypothetical protein CDL15_Pgr018389 [Punica granatum]